MGKKKAPPRPKAPPPPRPPRTPPPPADPADAPLDDDEQAWLGEFLVDRNPAMAYLRCHPDVTYRTARRNGRATRHRPHVDREVRAALAAQRLRCQVTADRVLDELAAVAFSDIYGLYDPATNQIRNPRHVPFDTRKAIASVRVGRQRQSTTTSGRTRTTVTESVVEYKLWPKVEALTKLMGHLGLSTALTPLEALLQALPPAIAAMVRAALAEQQKAVPERNGTH